MGQLYALLTPERLLAALETAVDQGRVSRQVANTLEEAILIA
jgi:hypothetical protein